MITPAILLPFFPKDDYLLVEVTDPTDARALLDSDGSTTWGAAKIGDTGYFKLAQCSPRTDSDKSALFVCKNELIGQ